MVHMDGTLPDQRVGGYRVIAMVDVAAAMSATKRIDGATRLCAIGPDGKSSDCTLGEWKVTDSGVRVQLR